MLAHGRWFSPDTPAASSTKTDRHDIVEILLKVAIKHQKSKSIIQVKLKFNFNHKHVDFSLVEFPFISNCTSACSNVVFNMSTTYKTGYYKLWKKFKYMVRVLVFNNNVSIISWWSVVLVEETGVSGEIHRYSAGNW